MFYVCRLNGTFKTFESIQNMNSSIYTYKICKYLFYYLYFMFVLTYFICIYTGIHVLNGFERFKCAVKMLNGQLVTSVPG